MCSSGAGTCTTAIRRRPTGAPTSRRWCGWRPWTGRRSSSCRRSPCGRSDRLAEWSGMTAFADVAQRPQLGPVPISGGLGRAADVGRPRPVPLGVHGAGERHPAGRGLPNDRSRDADAQPRVVPPGAGEDSSASTWSHGWRGRRSAGSARSSASSRGSSSRICTRRARSATPVSRPRSLTAPSGSPRVSHGKEMSW